MVDELRGVGSRGRFRHCRSAVSGLSSLAAPTPVGVKQVKRDRELQKVDAAILAAAATLREVADRLEAGARQAAAEVLRSREVAGLSIAVAEGKHRGGAHKWLWRAVPA